jgi:hypothetical protein
MEAVSRPKKYTMEDIRPNLLCIGSNGLYVFLTLGKKNIGDDNQPLIWWGEVILDAHGFSFHIPFVETPQAKISVVDLLREFIMSHSLIFLMSGPPSF